jgi:seryl-tRNA synthetase
MNTSIGTTEEKAFLEDLIKHGHFLPSGEAGIYGRGEVFEDVRNGLEALITRTGSADRPERLRFPPLIPKCTLARAGYLKSFPHLCGTVFSFAGNESAAADLVDRAQKDDDWSMHLSMTQVVLVPAACYPAYPVIARRGPLPKGGVTLDLGGSYVFRNEPSENPARLQMFHQREMVRIGEMEDVLAWRETWIGRARSVLEQCGLEPNLELASDPFFGRGGKLLAKSQREQSLKFELTVSIASEQPTAVASFNFHQEHFGSVFGIQLHDGRVSNSACLGFGLERIALALFRKHGLDVHDWPKPIRVRLWPDLNTNGSAS